MVGRALYFAEHALSCVWSVGEMVAACGRYRELPPDADTPRVLEDIEENGFYTDIPERPVLHRRRAHVVAELPYRFVSERRRAPHRVVARIVHARRPTRRLLVVFHCYGAPFPSLMSRLFGLSELDSVDVAFAIMNHHQSATYPLWPGTGLVSPSPACMLENVRASIAGARTLVRGLREDHGYEHVSVLGFSIGGHLAMHVANTERVDRAILYCPVVCVDRVSRELGVMRTLHPHLVRAARALDLGYRPEILQLANPLRYPLRVEQERVDVVAQRHDAMTTLWHVRSIREKYPRVGWHELDGAHVIPFGISRVHEIVRAAA
ncbi:MAG: alpha/beta fold hydrolase [Polyangiales bacterium]